MFKNELIGIYDKYTIFRNEKDFKKLTQDVFESYGIYSYHDLLHYLKKHGEYGGAVSLATRGKLVLLPFHNDVMNTWLKFDNPRVTQIYDKIYEQFGDEYSDRTDFNKHRFEVEEKILIKCWAMPAMDTRILNAPVAGCWDMMEIKACYLEVQGYQVKRYCFYGDKIIRGHPFILYNDGKYWNTSLGFPLHIRMKNLQNLCRFVFCMLKHVPFLKKATSTLVEFSTPYEGMSTEEYVELINNGKVILKN